MKQQASKKKLVEQTVARLEEAQAATLAAIERISTRFDIDNRPKPPIDETNSAVIRYLDTAANYALYQAGNIKPEVADVKAHPLPAFQDLTVAPVSKRTLKDTADEITDYLNDELRYLAPGMMRGLEDFLVWYQGKFLEALHRLTEKKIAVCDTLGKTDAKRKLIEAFSALPSFATPEAFEDYNQRILAGDDPDSTEKMVRAWRKHQPAPFPSPEEFAELFRDALKKDAEATDEINGKAATAAPDGFSKEDRATLNNINVIVGEAENNRRATKDKQRANGYKQAHHIHAYNAENESEEQRRDLKEAVRLDKKNFPDPTKKRPYGYWKNLLSHAPSCPSAEALRKAVIRKREDKRGQYDREGKKRGPYKKSY